MKTLIYPANAKVVKRLAAQKVRSYNFIVNELLTAALRKKPLVRG